MDINGSYRWYVEYLFWMFFDDVFFLAVEHLSTYSSKCMRCFFWGFCHLHDIDTCSTKVRFLGSWHWDVSICKFGFVKQASSKYPANSPSNGMRSDAISIHQLRFVKRLKVRWCDKRKSRSNMKEDIPLDQIEKIPPSKTWIEQHPRPFWITELPGANPLWSHDVPKRSEAYAAWQHRCHACWHPPPQSHGATGRLPCSCGPKNAGSPGKVA